MVSCTVVHLPCYRAKGKLARISVLGGTGGTDRQSPKKVRNQGTMFRGGFNKRGMFGRFPRINLVNFIDLGKGSQKNYDF